MKLSETVYTELQGFSTEARIGMIVLIDLAMGRIPLTLIVMLFGISEHARTLNGTQDPARCFRSAARRFPIKSVKPVPIQADSSISNRTIH